MSAATHAAAGVAIFVKTPGHSPLKTRLAAGIGAGAAREFHLRSATAVAAVVRATQAALPRLDSYWAVAEESALDDPLWQRLARLPQGEGDLGARMGRVCEALRVRHGRALLMGADTPQLRADDLVDAVRALDAHDHVLGPSEDGGFWLFGTRTTVPDAAWSATPWSHADTARRFEHALVSGDGHDHAVPDPCTWVARLRTLRDVDTTDDLAPLLGALEALPDPLVEQANLACWLRGLL